MEWRASLEMCLSCLEQRFPTLPEVNELSHLLKLEELCNSRGGCRQVAEAATQFLSPYYGRRCSPEVGKPKLPEPHSISISALHSQH